ncbi:hypothetical protein Q8146_003755 [Salmonella enterica]|nr:hypothetical protein [Salmonella enterica]
MSSLEKLVEYYRAGEQIGIYSICSAYLLVTGTTLEQMFDNGYSTAIRDKSKLNYLAFMWAYYRLTFAIAFCWS